MPITEYFQRFTYDPPPEHGSAPTEVAWTSVGDLAVRGARIYVGDSWAIAADSISFAVPSGRYEITAECFAYGTDGRVARLRGLLPGRRHDAARLEGEFGVDVASAGVIDADSLDRWADSDEQAFEEWCEQFVNSRLKDQSVAGFHPCPGAGVSMVHTSTGFGDGSYRAFTLTAGAETVGFELVFLEPGQGYLQDDPHEAG
jgi:hypothetical protein